MGLPAVCSLAAAAAAAATAQISNYWEASVTDERNSGNILSIV